MTVLSTDKISSLSARCSVIVLMLCFSVITLFGSPLHDHDFEPSHVDSDCISCHLVNANIGLEHDEPDPSSNLQVTELVSVATTPTFIADKPSVSSRAPPVIC